jgi:ribosomal protein S18 acetylase RimI-like enzyme
MRDTVKFTSGGDAVGPEYHGYINAEDSQTGRILGQVTYSYYQGENYIRYIEVRADCKRRGIGTALIDRLREDGGAIGMVGNFATDEGIAFIKSVMA